MTIRDAAHLYRVSERTIRRWITNGELSSIIAGGATHVSAPAVEARAERWRNEAGRRRARPRDLPDLT